MRQPYGPRKNSRLQSVKPPKLAVSLNKLLNHMPSAEIITIGTEILLGEIVDTNARHLALSLREAGIDLYRKTTVGDNPRRIAQAIQETIERCDIVITTGGLGPTVDDPTRDAIALAIGVSTEFHPELWDQIQARFQALQSPANRK